MQNESRVSEAVGEARRDWVIFPLLLLLAGGICLFPAAMLGLSGFTISVCLFAALGLFIRERVLLRERLAGAAIDDLQAQVEEARVNYRSIFENAAQGIFQSTPEGSFITANPALVRMLGMRNETELRNEMSGWPARHAFADPARWEALRRFIEKQDSVADFKAEIVRQDGRTIWVSQNVHAVRDHEGELLYLEGTIHDITAQHWAECRRSLHLATAEIFAECPSVAEARPRILQAICELLEWEMGAVWQVSVAENLLRCVEVWHRQGIDIAEFEDAALEIPFEPGMHLSGKVWQTGEPAWVVNFTELSFSQSALVAARGGMNSAFAIPVKMGGEVSHVLEFFSPKASQPDPELLQMLGVIAGQIGHLLERKQAEETLRDTVLRKTAILESALDPIITFDRKGTIMEWNPAAERIFGYAQGEALGNRLSDLILPEAGRVGPFGGLPLYAASAGLGRRSEITAQRADGTTFPAEIAISKAPTHGAGLFTAYLRDLTEPRRSSELRQWVEAFLSLSDEAILATTPEGRIDWWSPGAERLLGFAPQEAIGAPLWLLFGPEERAAAEEEVRILACGGRIEHERAVRVRRNGSPIDLKWTGAAVHNERGMLVRLLFVAREAEENELPLEVHLQAQKMEAIGRLAGGVAHDFNNILTAILGYADLLSGQVTPGSAAQESAREIAKAGRFASSITRQLLTFSRGDAREIEVFDLEKTVTTMTPMLRRLAGEGVRLRVVPEGEGFHIKADAGELEQVLLNLVLNARDALAGEGEVWVRLARRRVREEGEFPGIRPGQWVEMQVVDNGLGMSETVKRHIFEPFFTTKKRGQGTGLGLATCYSIVRHAGGQIRCESEPGEGATFSVWLPHVAGVEVQAGGEEAGQAPGGLESVLVVEDEEVVRRVAASTLRQLGYTVREAANAEEARALLEAEPESFPELLVSDVVESCGCELAEWMRARQPDTVVLFITGSIEKAFRDGVPDEVGTACLQKPFTPTKLARQVRSLLDHPGRRVR